MVPVHPLSVSVDVLRSAEGISPSSAELGSSLWAARRSLGSSTKAGEVSANSAALWMAARDQHVAASTKTSALPVVAWAVNEIANTGYRPVGGATQYYYVGINSVLKASITYRNDPYLPIDALTQDARAA